MNSNFTMIPNESEDYYAKDKRLNILHLYITERVRSFDSNKMTCYLTNEQFALATGSSISTISRAIKLLIDTKILWAGYHQESIKNKQRILRIYNAETDRQIDYEPDCKDSNSVSSTLYSLSDCLDEMVNMTTSDSQIDALVYKENTKRDKLTTKVINSDSSPKAQNNFLSSSSLLGNEGETMPEEPTVIATIKVDQSAHEKVYH